MCLYPIKIKNKRYTITEKNKGIIPRCPDERLKTVWARCGKCIECKQQIARDWKIRLSNEIEKKINEVWFFVTLTINEESLYKIEDELGNKGIEITDNEIAKITIRRFTELYRYYTKKAPRHFLITELGQNNTERLHLHGLIRAKDKSIIEKIWKYGNIYIGEYVNSKTINYITKYILKQDTKHKNFSPKIFASKGLGNNFITKEIIEQHKFKGEETKDYYIDKKGYKTSMPLYYRNKIYTDEEKEQLFKQKIEKEIIYVRGEKIDIKTTEGIEEYQKLLKYYQKQNKQLGYGDRQKNFNDDLEKLRKNQRRLRKLKYENKKC